MTAAAAPDLARILDAQFGLITQAQFRALRLPRSRVQHRVESGRWQAIFRGVYATTTGPLTREMRLMAALLVGGDHAILSHRTSGEEWRMIRIDPDSPVHITVPYGKSAIDHPAAYVQSGVGRPTILHPGVVVHRSRAHRHIAVATPLPRTTKADTAIDMAVDEPTAEAAHVSLIATATNGGIRLNDIRRRLEERKPYRYQKALADAVKLLAEGVQSMLEYLYAIEVEQAHGLPSARRQGTVIVDGRTLYEDCDYSNCGVPLIVRLDGRLHAVPEIVFRDRRRDNAAELADRPRLTFGFDEVSKDSCGVAGEVEQVLTREGWEREVENPCPACARLEGL